MNKVEKQALHRFGYAVSLFAGAAQILKDEANVQAPFIVSAYLLIGFSIENALASYLIAADHPSPGDYKSHRLEAARLACAGKGLVFGNEGTAFIQKIDPYHRDFVFRYPEKMKTVILDARKGVVLTYQIIRDVETGLKMHGLNPIVEVEKPDL